MEEITIKVPAPFAGVSDLGFTAQYPGQTAFSRARDVPLLIEGPPGPMRKLVERLRLLREPVGESHAWTDPVLLADEVAVIAFRDQSLAGRTLEDGAQGSLDYVCNLVRPVCFPFLQDCALRAGLRLAERIEIQVQAPHRLAEMELRLDQIVRPNGHVVLWSP
ncbi:MAG: hypothetical protein ACREPA_04530 [Candidatus Dormibacteraceae bacterium]